jgi:hypothetical protein
VIGVTPKDLKTNSTSSKLTPTDPTPRDVTELREQVVGAMPWYDDAHPDYTELDAILRAALTRSELVPLDVARLADHIFIQRQFETVCAVTGCEHPPAADPPALDDDFPNTEDYWRGYRDGRAFAAEPPSRSTIARLTREREHREGNAWWRCIPIMDAALADADTPKYRIDVISTINGQAFHKQEVYVRNGDSITIDFPAKFEVELAKDVTYKIK